MTVLGVVFIYLIIINIITFITFGVDKRKAKKNKWRVSEQVLIILMLVGGLFGGYFGMEKFHHKTQKFKFKLARITSVLTFIAIIALAFYIGF